MVRFGYPMVNSVVSKQSVERSVYKMGATIAYHYSRDSKSRKNNALEKLMTTAASFLGVVMASTHLDT